MCAKKQVKRKDQAEILKAIKFKSEADAAEAVGPFLHIYHNGAVCDTDKAGYASPRDRNPVELVVDASEGFIPLWSEGSTLRWRFQERSMTAFQDSLAAKAYLRDLMGEALLLWGAAVPVRFTEVRDAWDFEIVVSPQERCSANGCTLASAFFPEPGQNELKIYPTLFSQPREEQIETMAHEFGHVFGLRHFFAQISETRWRSEIFGNHQPFSIMNYGSQSVMTEADKSDLGALYKLAWTGALAEINGTPIQLVEPYSSLRFLAMDSGLISPGPAAVAFRHQR